MIFLDNLSLLLPIVLLLILYTTAGGVSLHRSSNWIATSAQSELILVGGNRENGAVDCSIEGTLKNLKRRGRLNNRRSTPESSCAWQTPLKIPTAPATGTENTLSPAGQQSPISNPDKIPKPRDRTELSPQDLYGWFYGPNPFSNPCGKNPKYPQYILPVCHPVLVGGSSNLPFAVPEEEMTSFGLTSNDYPRGWLVPCRQCEWGTCFNSLDHI